MSSGHQDLVLRLLDDAPVRPVDVGTRQVVASMPQIVWTTRPGDGAPGGGDAHGEALRDPIEDQYLAVLEARATRDPLTDLPDRSALFERLELLLSQRHRAGIAVAFIDLDEFKPVNDRFGHRGRRVRGRRRGPASE